MEDYAKNSVPPRRTPGWVKAFYVAGALFVIVFALLHLTGRTPHGHSMHPPTASTDTSP